MCLCQEHNNTVTTDTTEDDGGTVDVTVVLIDIDDVSSISEGERSNAECNGILQNIIDMLVEETETIQISDNYVVLDNGDIREISDWLIDENTQA